MAYATDSPTSLANRAIEKGDAFYSDGKNVFAVDSYTHAINIIPYVLLKKIRPSSCSQAEAVKLVNMRRRLASDLETRGYEEAHDFHIMINDLFKRPISTYLHDKRFMRALGVMSNVVKIQDAYEELHDGEDVLWMERKSLEFPTSKKD
ncbi:hypothetical protein Tco_0285136 [Tanacetum coccineum]